MARKDAEYLKKIMKKYNVDRLWSWSRLNTYMNSPYEYMLKYVEKVKTDQSPSIYLIQGGACHEILEDFYLNKIKYDDMINKYENALFDLEIMDLKYDRTDEEKNFKISQRYENSVKHFYKNHKIINKDIRIEDFITIKIKDEVAQGYIDALVKDEEGVNIIDWKTSTLYVGKKIEKEIGQLKLYALGLVQKGVPIEKIKVGWNFLKYQNITYKQKNGKLKTKSVLRCDSWMDELQKNIISWAKDLKLDLDFIIECIAKDDFESLPKELKSLYKIDDCYILKTFTKKELDDFEEKLYNIIKEIKTKEKQYEVTGNDDIFWDEEINQDSTYYFYNLCGYSRRLHKPWNEYLENLEMFIDNKEDDDFDLDDI